MHRPLRQVTGHAFRGSGPHRERNDLQGVRDAGTRHCLVRGKESNLRAPRVPRAQLGVYVCVSFCFVYGKHYCLWCTIFGAHRCLLASGWDSDRVG